MPDRFFCTPFPAGESTRLEGTEAHHLQRVLRKSVGDLVEIFDGEGRVASAEITHLSKKTVELKILDRSETPAPRAAVILATAVPKGDRFRWLVEKAVELNVDRLVPLITQRSVVNPGEGKREKMEQAVIEACKQCGRNRLMAIDEPIAWSDFVQHNLDKQNHAAALFADPSGAPIREVFPKNIADSLVLMVGPEGGWTEEEISEARSAGAIAVGLGPNILRIETAAVALAAYATFQR